MMKASFRLIFAALVATAALVGCTKEITPSFENDKVNSEGSRVIAVSFGQQTKTTLDGFQPRFNNRDSILISNGEALDTCEVKVDDKTKVATITTNLTGPLTAVYPYKAAKMNETNKNQIDTVLVSTEQDGSFASANICMAKNISEEAKTATFENKTALFKIIPGAGESTQYVEVSADGFEIANDVPTGSTHTSLETIHVNTTTADSVYVSILVPEGLKVSDLTFSDGTNEKSVTTGATADKDIAAGTLYTVTNANWESTEADIPDGALKGVFSVSADKQVYFSHGNLVATIDASGAPTAWKFAAQQYDYLGEGGANKTIGKTAGDVDLFGWSTENTNYGISTSTTSSDYFGDFKDWGQEIGDGKIWRTLTNDEWSYLFSYDETQGGKYADKTNFSNEIREGKYKNNVTVCGISNCVVLLPDDWQWDTDDEKKYGTGWQKNMTSDVIEYSETTTVTWSTMQDAGAVCLPATGYRSNFGVSSAGLCGRYWSSSAAGGDFDAYIVYFDGGSVYPNSFGDHRYIGSSVRLVTDVSAAPTPTEPDYVEITAKYDGEDQPARALKWATKNLGADNETDYGKYYAWGDTEGQAAATSGTGAFATAFDWANCPFNNGSSNYDETYFNGIKNTVCPDGVLAKNHDVANKVLGGTWRMPTKEEFDALCSLTKTWKTDYNNSGINGYLFTDKNGNSIFLPAAGYGDDTDFENVDGIGGCYWSSSLEDTSNQEAYYLGFTCEVGASTVSDGRFYGHPVRPVSE